MRLPLLAALLCCGLLAAADAPAMPGAQAVLDQLNRAPAIKALGIGQLTAIDHGFTCTIGSEQATVFACDARLSGWAIAIRRPAWTLPGGLDLKDALLVVVGGDTPVETGRLPKAIHDRLAAVGPLPERFRAGITLAADASGHPGSALAKALVQAGLAGCSARGTLATSLLRGQEGDFEVTLHAASWAPPALAGAVQGRDLTAQLARAGTALRFAGHAAVRTQLPPDLRLPACDFGGVLAIDDLAAAEPRLTFRSDHGSAIAWNDVLGQDWLDLAVTGLQADLAGGSGTVAIQATFDRRPVLVTLLRQDGAFTDAVVEVPGSLPLRHLPGLRDLPGVRDLAIEDPRLGRRSCSGSLSFHGNAVDALLFLDAAGRWNGALSLRKPIAIGALLGHAAPLLSQLTLPAPHLLMLPDGLRCPLPDLPLPARTLLGSLGLPGDVPLALPKGILLHGVFDPGQLEAPLRLALGKLGLSAPMPVIGTIGGLFGGAPSLDLRARLPAAPKTVFTFLEPHADATWEFFVTQAGEEVDVGFRSTATLAAGDDQPPLVFDIACQVEARQAGLEVAVSGDLRGAWKDALGIKGLDIAGPHLEAGLNAAGGFDVLIAGTITLGGQQVKVAANTVVLPEAGFVPEAVAFCGQTARLPLAGLVACAETLARAKGGALRGGGVRCPAAELRDVTFAFVSPEAHLPPALAEKLHLDGAGMALAGSLRVGGHDLGAVSGFVSDAGMGFDCALTPFHLGPLEVSNAKLDLRSGAAIDPCFRLAGDLALGRTREHCTIDIEAERYVVATELDIGDLHIAISGAGDKGLAGGPDEDIAFTGTLAGDCNAIAEAAIHQAVRSLRTVDSRLAKAQGDVAEAQKAVDATTVALADARRSAQQRYDSASSSIRSAERKVDELKDKERTLKDRADEMASKAKHAAKHLKLGDAARYGAREAAAKSELVGVYAARKTADAALEAARKAVNVVPVEADPTVVAQAARLGTEKAALATAQATLAALRSADQELAKAAAALDRVLDAVKVTAITVSGSMQGLSTGGTRGRAPALAVTCSIAGAKHVYVVDVGAGDKPFATLIQTAAAHAAQDVVASVIK